MAERFIPPEGRDSKELAAMHLVFKYSGEFAENFPTIIDDVTAGLSSKEIAIKYHVQSLYNVTETIACSIVVQALQLLLSPDERSAIYSEKRKEYGRALGRATQETNTGLFSLTPEQRQEASRKAGKVGGPLTYEKRLAFFALSPEELKRRQKKGALERADSWFGDPIIDGKSEGEYVLWALQQPEFQNTSGAHKGRPDYTKITEAVNKLYGKNRSRVAVKGVGENQKKKKG